MSAQSAAWRARRRQPDTGPLGLARTNTRTHELQEHRVAVSEGGLRHSDVGDCPPAPFQPEPEDAGSMPTPSTYPEVLPESWDLCPKPSLGRTCSSTTRGPVI